MRTSITEEDIKNNVSAIKDVLLEFGIDVAKSRITWGELGSFFKNGPMSKSQGGTAWVSNVAFHVDLPYIDLQLPKANP